MNIKINNQEVKIEKRKDKDGNVLKKGDRAALKYTFKAFSNGADGGDDNWKFYEDKLKTDENLKDHQDKVCSALFYNLSAHSAWDFIGGRADMWGCLVLQNYETQDNIYVEFDCFEHGLLAAYLIAKEINPADFE